MKQWKPKQPVDPEQVYLYRPYAVFINPDVPPELNDVLMRIAQTLSDQHYTVRIDGGDLTKVFEEHAKLYELHLPWRGFNNKDAKSYFNTDEVNILASRYHPTYASLKPTVQAFLGRNVRMMVGKDLKGPALFLICWTSDGVESGIDRTSRTGFAGHIIAIATAMHVPIFNLRNPDALHRLEKYLSVTI